MTIPEPPNDLRPWLEALVARGEAARLASELATVHACTVTPVVVPEALASLVCDRGFAPLSDAQVQELLQQPGLLLALAEEVFLNGGPYWTSRLEGEPAYETQVATGRRRLLATLAPVVPARAKPRARVGWVAGLGSLAAAVLVVLIVNPFRSPDVPPTPKPTEEPRWGWQKTDELAQLTQPADYLERIATLAQEWKQQETPTASALAIKIKELRLGCTHLQEMDHPPLNATQRADLLARCQKWATKFDQSLIDLETTGDVAQVRQTMDATIEQLTNVLREQASKIRTAT